jgi:hypothetical protein
VPFVQDDSPYRRGTRYELMPIPMVHEHCHRVAAGAVDLVIESRRLTDAVLAETYGADDPREEHVHFDDGGASIHVCGADDGLEYLRFDCFELEPHYHYIDPHEGTQVMVRIDELAVGDPERFALDCLATRLPGMVRFTGAQALADAVEATHDRVLGALDEVRVLLARSRGVERAADDPTLSR